MEAIIESVVVMQHGNGEKLETFSVSSFDQKKPRKNWFYFHRENAIWKKR